jgi:hypothetical protein
MKAFIDVDAAQEPELCRRLLKKLERPWAAVSLLGASRALWLHDQAP